MYISHSHTPFSNKHHQATDFFSALRIYSGSLLTKSCAIACICSSVACYKNPWREYIFCQQVYNQGNCSCLSCRKFECLTLFYNGPSLKSCTVKSTTRLSYTHYLFPSIDAFGTCTFDSPIRYTGRPFASMNTLPR